MSSVRITREYIENLKLKRRKKIRRIVTLTVSGFVLIAVGITCIVFSAELFPDRQGSEVSVGTHTNLGDSNTSVLDYENTGNSSISSPQEPSSENTSDDTTEIDYEDIVFEVPDTSLPPVEEIEGDNWYNDYTFTNNDELVGFEYFDDTVFIGDSRTEGLLLFSGLPNLNGFCYKGLSVDKLENTQNIIIPGYSGQYSCYEAISMTEYDNYYCMFGVNELGWVSIDAFVEHLSGLIDHIQSVNSEAVIYIESILPVSKKVSEENDIYKQERINEFNRKIKDMCMSRKDVIYLDISSAVIGEDGYLPEEASPDGIHCNADYCKRIIQYIRYNTFTKK